MSSFFGEYIQYKQKCGIHVAYTSKEIVYQPIVSYGHGSGGAGGYQNYQYNVTGCGGLVPIRNQPQPRKT